METAAIVALVVVALVAAIVVAGFRQRKITPVSGRSAATVSLELDATPDKPMGFGYKNAWLAIKANDPKKVAQCLGLEDLQPANWRTGLAASYEHYETHVFVTPPVNGWVFVVGTALPDCGDSDRPDKCTPLLKELGRTYDPVFYFGTHRVVEFHAWARVDKARVSRAYAYLGEKGLTIWNKGEKTRAEQELKFNFFADAPPEGQGQEYWDRKDLRFPNEEDVIRIAEAWTINPLKLEEMHLPEGAAFVGQVPSAWR